MWLCTLPSESSPMRWKVEERSRTRSVSDCQTEAFSPSKSVPSAIARATSLAPWSKIRPAPRALCPTSLLPMSPSEGMPTARPCARSERDGAEAASRSS